MAHEIFNNAPDAALSAANPSAPATKTVDMPIGIPCYTLHQEQRSVPAS